MSSPRQDATALISHTASSPWPLWLLSDWLPAAQANQLLEQLDSELEWQQPSITLFGKRHTIPRSQVWMGDANSRYRYSGRDFEPTPWTPLLLTLCQRLNAIQHEAALQLGWHQPPPLNSVLLNRYQDGQQKMGFHSDNEPELGPNPIIWSISLGEPRDMRFKPASGVSGDAFNLRLPHGSLLVMGPDSQRLLQHGIPARSRGGLRINLTFRSIVAAG
ncbi:alpha-ketoglutarate-dependent dioxygenase AlkB family protein [Carnimonas bestiolae]|uniref:alpha-ketoglutarate-dependent dioxygenase AlkB family protein n=1 Tax=Carnimonas bestiolae TaxID=3402172 RepID=UPI003EDC286F